MKELVAVARLSELRDDRPTAVQVEGVDLVMVKCHQGVSIFHSCCPSGGTSLAEATVDDGILVCPNHGCCFDCISGEKVDEPAVILPGLSASIQGDVVFVRPSEVRGWRRGSQ
jgi:nitrite reductase/ring-hydroxylating ferredoxin subunit